MVDFSRGGGDSRPPPWYKFGFRVWGINLYEDRILLGVDDAIRALRELVGELGAPRSKVDGSVPQTHLVNLRIV